MDELEEEKRGFGGLFIFGEVGEDTAFFLAAERRVGHDEVHAVSIADFAQGKTKRIFRVDIG